MAKKLRKQVEELRIPLRNGGMIVCGRGERWCWGGYVRVLNTEGEEIAYWDKAEFAEEPELVLGALLACASSLKDLRKWKEG